MCTYPKINKVTAFTVYGFFWIFSDRSILSNTLDCREIVLLIVRSFSNPKNHANIQEFYITSKCYGIKNWHYECYFINHYQTAGKNRISIWWSAYQKHKSGFWKFLKNVHINSLHRPSYHSCFRLHVQLKLSANFNVPEKEIDR